MSTIGIEGHSALSRLERKHLDKPIQFVVQRKNGYGLGLKDARRVVGVLESFFITDTKFLASFRVSGASALTLVVKLDEEQIAFRGGDL